MKTKIIRYLPGFTLVALMLLLVWSGKTSFTSLAAPASAPNQFCLTMIETDPHHLGDTSVPSWAVPNPEGTEWSKTFNTPILDTVLVRFETYEAGDAKVRLNGQVVLEIGDEPPNWKYHAILIDRQLLVRDGNLIRFETNAAADRDDFMFRNIGLVTCYSTLEFNPHHLGNTTSAHWLIPNPEGTSRTIPFPLSESVPGTSLLALEVFDNTEPTQIKVNGTVVGSVQNGVPETWKQLSVVVPGDLLDPQNNTLVITSGPIGGADGPWDDLIFKNVRLFFETRSTEAIYMPQIR